MFSSQILRPLGAFVIDLLKVLGGIGNLTLNSIKSAYYRPFYFNLFVEQIYSIGVRSLLLVCVTGLAAGSVMALQFGYGLEKFGGKLYVPKVVALSMIREMGPVFTSLMVAGRVGSGMAAEIGSMQVTQQIDAIRALGTSPLKRIVIPRVLACIIALPLLTIIVDIIGLISAMLVCLELGIGAYFFWEKVVTTLVFNDVWTSLLKTSFFGFLIAISACYKGMRTEGGTRGVGDSTTWVVVMASVSILISNFFITKLFLILFPFK